MNLSYFVKAPKSEPRAKAAWWACIANESQKEIERTGQHCTRAFGCLVVPSEYGLEAENPFLDEFRQEGVAVVSSGLVEYRADKGWDAPFACDELRANISALMVWANDRGMRE